MAEQDILSKIGVGSGLDTTALIQALVDADSAPQKESLDRDEEDTEAKISALGMLKSNLQSFNNILENIKVLIQQVLKVFLPVQQKPP